MNELIYEAGILLCFFVFMGLLGYIAWKMKRRRGKRLGINKWASGPRASSGGGGGGC